MCERCKALEEENRILRFHLQAVVGAESDLHVEGIGSYMTERGLIDVTMRRKDVAHFQEVCADARSSFPDLREWTL